MPKEDLIIHEKRGNKREHSVRLRNQIHICRIETFLNFKPRISIENFQKHHIETLANHRFPSPHIPPEHFLQVQKLHN